MIALAAIACLACLILGLAAGYVAFHRPERDAVQAVNGTLLLSEITRVSIRQPGADPAARSCAILAHTGTEAVLIRRGLTLAEARRMAEELSWLAFDSIMHVEDFASFPSGGAEGEAGQNAA